MNNTSPSESNMIREVREKVLGKIEHGNVHMRSRVHFIARLALLTGLAALVLIISAFVLSFILFNLHESGEQFLLGFGIRGIQTFIILFPWIPLGIDIVLILLLQAMLQSFKFGYRAPLVLLFAAAFLGSAALGVLVNLTPLHTFLLDRADHDELPILGEFYEPIHGPHEEQGVFHGTVTSVASGTITICDTDDDADDATRTVRLPADFHSVPPQVGDQLFIFGTSNGESVDAYGVECIHCR